MTAGGVKFRECGPQDREAVDQLVERAAREIRKHLGRHPETVKMRDLAARGCICQLAVLDSRIVGCVSYRIRGGRLHVFNLAIDFKHRRSGIGRELMLKLEQIGAAAKARNVTVQTIEDLGVAPFFESLGYRIQNRKREFLFAPDRERALTTVYMIKTLNGPSTRSSGKWW